MAALLGLLTGLALAAPGLRTDGVVPPLNQGEGAMFAALQTDTSGTTRAVQAGITGGFGLPQDVGLSLTLGMSDGQMLNAELRAETPLLGRRDDPLLSVLGGIDATDAAGGFARTSAYAVELGAVAGGDVAPRLRLYGGATADSRLDELLAGAVRSSLSIEPALGLCWRPKLQPHLSARLSLEAQGWTDLDQIRFGPAVIIGIGGE